MLIDTNKKGVILKPFSIALCCLLLVGCASKEPLTQQKLTKKTAPKTLRDLEELPQEAFAYSFFQDAHSIGDIDSFVQDYFRVWNLQKISIDPDEAMWAFESFDANNSYSMTLQALEEDFFRSQKQNCNLSRYGTINKNAITLKTLNLRAMPTDEPLFLDPKKAGEGYPFDYLQNSLIAANKPLFVSHYSADKKWVFVETSFGFGWLKSRDIAYIDEKYTDIWQKAKQVFLLKDGVAINDAQGHYLFDSRVGMVLPLIDEDAKNYYVLTVSADKADKPYYNRSAISKKIASSHLLKFEKKSIDAVLGELQKGRYGWGGIYEQRDCSATLRDFFTPFGLWLPRNSSSQSKVGKVISLKGMRDAQKLQIIKQQAKPFSTLLYKPGHIALYVGTFNDQVVIFQNVWGVKTKKGEKEGRYIVAKPVFSTLELGKELDDFDPKASMLFKLESMNILDSSAF
ncbi:MAG: SH3 domain-containing protein [Epsilonproteobacteria bacterium]|nr:SH3 domain-containing protein [Campylobacterota bacterium]